MNMKRVIKTQSHQNTSKSLIYLYTCPEQYRGRMIVTNFAAGHLLSSNPIAPDQQKSARDQ
jgi:hypothetical protein